MGFRRYVLVRSFTGIYVRKLSIFYKNYQLASQFTTLILNFRLSLKVSYQYFVIKNKI